MNRRALILQSTTVGARSVAEGEIVECGEDEFRKLAVMGLAKEATDEESKPAKAKSK